MLNTQEPYTLEDDVALLRPLQSSDYDLLLPFAHEQPDIWRYTLQHPGSDEGMRKYIDLALAARDKGTEYPFIVIDKRNGQPAGSTRFYDIQNEHRTVQLGYTWYGGAYQRTGLNRHCKYLLLQKAFEDWDMLRVEFRADADNARSIAAMKAIGCVEEGILRNHLFNHVGGRRNSIILSILQDEWHGGVKERLRQKLQQAPV